MEPIAKQECFFQFWHVAQLSIICFVMGCVWFVDFEAIKCHLSLMSIFGDS
jgi:hypothetical protein